MIDIASVKGLPRLWLKASNVPAEHQGWRKHDVRTAGYASDTTKRLWSWQRRVCAGEVIGKSGKGLLLQGPPGQGKTTIASVLLNEIALNSSIRMLQPDETKTPPLRPVYFIDYPALLRAQRKLMNLDEGEEWLRLTRICEGVFGEHELPEWNIQVLVIDDVGKEHTTHSGWAEDTFNELLRARKHLGLPTIVTTNTPLHKIGDEQDWQDSYGESMASFAHQAFDVINLLNREGDQRRAG